MRPIAPGQADPNQDEDRRITGDWLRARRAGALLTQEELAARSGVDARTIRAIETGRTPKPRASTRRLLLEVLDTAEQREIPSSRTSAPGFRPRELPADTFGFTGRTTELSTLDRQLESVESQQTATPIILISGTPGVGKTALAVHWAHQIAGRFPDGQLCVNLHGYDARQPVSPDEALATFLRSLGVTGSAVPPERADRAKLFRTMLADRRMLILLDNAHDVTQIRELLPGGSTGLVLITTRDTMAGLAVQHGLHRVVLDRLPVDDALALLRSHIGERADHEPDATATLADQCARLPLALRIAAQLTSIRPTITIAELTSELVDEKVRLDLLDVGDQYSSTRAVFSWSYQHLSEPAARLFRLWGAQPAKHLDKHAIGWLADLDPAETRRAVDTLARAHLIQEIGCGRFAMHDLLSCYAQEQARTIDPEEANRAALSRLFDFYVRTTARATDTLTPIDRYRTSGIPRDGSTGPTFSDRSAAIAWLDSERTNLIAAALYAAKNGWPRQAVQFSNVLFRYLDNGVHRSDAERVHTAALHVAVHWRLGSYAEALAKYQHALALLQEFGDESGMSYTLGHIGIMHSHLDSYDEAHEHLEQAVMRLLEDGDIYGESAFRESLGLVCSQLGRYDDAFQHYRRTLALAHELGDRHCETDVLNSMGTTARDAGDPAAGLGLCHRDLGSADDAREHWRIALGIHTELGTPEAIPIAARLALRT